MCVRVCVCVCVCVCCLCVCVCVCVCMHEDMCVRYKCTSACASVLIANIASCSLSVQGFSGHITFIAY